MYMKKTKGQELTLEAHHMKCSRYLNIYFQCLLRLPDQSNINEMNREYRSENPLSLIFLTVYYSH